MKAPVLTLLAAAAFLAGRIPAIHATEATARISHVWTEKTNVVVEVQTSGPVLKVTLESSPRVGRRAWEPRAVHYFTNGEPAEATITFSVPLLPSMELLRVRSDLIENSLPAKFYMGTNSFVAGSDGSGAVRGGVEGAPTTDTSSPGTDAGRTVVESDIWNLDGDQLLFFNQYRGLQVIDVSNPDQPKITGAYDVAASGEQMYLLDHTKIVLLAQDNCGWYGSGAESRLILLEVRNGVPELVKTLPVSGQIAESRLVGTALYVVANSYQSRAVPAAAGGGTSQVWEWGSEVSSYDLSDFANAERKSTAWVTGYGNVIYATDQYLFVAQADYSGGRSTSLIHLFDISAPDGNFTKLNVIGVDGTVRDKFKMSVTRGTFVVVEQETGTPRGTYVTTFSLANPAKPIRLAHVKLIENEQLFATRFDGDVLYVVTFFVVDPLWIVDLSDPAAPKKVGELEIPGYSTFLQPIGDKLLAIGLDRTNGYQRTAVQLFDVANPAKPSLLSKVLIGDQWSGSEANWDEKAFGVLPEENLVLVPFYSSGTDGYFQGVQLIDLEPTQLVKRGAIMQNLGARRATVHRDRILSLSGRELLTVDATDRDHPVVTETTELSWAADQVHLVGDFVIEVDAYGSSGPVLRVVDAADSSQVRSLTPLKNLPYLGSTVSGKKLLVLQGKAVEYVYPPVYDPNNYQPIATNPAVYLVTAFDLDQLPALQPAGSDTRESNDQLYLYGRYDALEVKPGLVVWSSGNRNGYPWWWLDRGGGPILAAAAPVDIARPIWIGGNTGHMLAVDTASPSFVSEVRLSGTNDWWNFSDAFTAKGLVYTSHSISEYDPTIDPPPYTWEYFDGAKMVTVTNDPPAGVWVQKYYLDAVDFNDPAEPIVRKPASIPGSLIGIDHGGELLYTRAYDLANKENVTASAYDGVEAHRIDSFALGDTWPRPTLVKGPVIYAGIASADGTGGALEWWTLADTGKFERSGRTELKMAAQQLGPFDDLLALQSDELLLFNVADPFNPKPIGSGRVNLCYGVQLDAADGNAERGLWLPIGWYGVAHLPPSNPPAGAN